MCVCVCVCLCVQSETCTSCSVKLTVYTVSEAPRQLEYRKSTPVSSYDRIRSHFRAVHPFQSFQFWNWLSHLTCGETRFTVAAKYKSYTAAEFDWNRESGWTSDRTMTCNRYQSIGEKFFLETITPHKISLSTNVLAERSTKFYTLNFVVQTYSRKIKKWYIIN